MALRDCINNDEIRRLQQNHDENGGDWSKTRKSLPGVDPAALDAGFKEFIVSGGKPPSKKAAPAAPAGKPDPLK